MTYYYDENGTRHVLDETEASDKLTIACETIADLRSRCKWLEAENAKLRELVRDMSNCIVCNHDCKDCTINGEKCDAGVIMQRTCELGIEVDE